MGPRLFSRGNQEHEVIPRAMRLLQWGRDFSAAEMLLTVDTLATAYMLQWGRDFSAAEIALAAMLPLPAEPASMGPRLFSRGNEFPPESLGTKVVASMGPRLFSRGNC